MRRLAFITLTILIILFLACNAFAFTFIEEGFPKEPDHNKKWIMIQVNDEKYYFETAKEIDIDALGRDGYIYFDSDALNNGESIYIYEYNGTWKSQSVSKQIIELGREYKVLYTNYNISGEFSIIEPYMRFIENCLNVSDILAFCVVMFSVLISIYILKKSRCII